MKKIIFAPLFFFMTNLLAQGVLETYYEDWTCAGSPCAACFPVCNTDFTPVVYLNLAFASFNVGGTIANPILGGVTENAANIGEVINFVQSRGGKAKISFGGAASAQGGAYLIDHGSIGGFTWPSNVALLGQAVGNLINQSYAGYTFDGADFDIENPPGEAPANFANDVLSFLRNVRATVGANKILSLTLPAQGWGTYIQELAVAAAADKTLVNGQPVDTINYINFMEYDIWVPAGGGYAQRIIDDMVIYHQGPSRPGTTPWNIPYNKMQVGLMPGPDDLTPANNLTLTDAVNVANWAMSSGVNLHGLLMWDLNRDYNGIDGNASLAYYYALRFIASQAPISTATQAAKPLKLSKRAASTQTFVRQPMPTMGPPAS